ncbi:uncharacterized protein LOC128202600 [Galleria mellonella]|uniref:Uncharacterized protein LOC128202600 n=1 Tax=Galleria mellonella TaxID=7137 RepID=A0ABM3N7K0_GALME|nr:uncharacterized protein LOC128202600 [Galleria mellonella]
MIGVLVVVLFVLLSCAHGQGMSTESPSHKPPIPFMDLFTGASNYYTDPIRKIYSDQDSYSVSCPKSDTLSSFANVLSSAAKIMISAAIIVFFKFMVGKLMLFPLIFVLLGKISLKIFLLWPMLSKIMKYFKKKKKKGHKGRMITDCSQRVVCVIQRSSKDWGSNLGAATTFLLIDDIDKDSSYAKAMLHILAGDNVAECMSMDCYSGTDIS